MHILFVVTNVFQLLLKASTNSGVINIRLEVISPFFINCKMDKSRIGLCGAFIPLLVALFNLVKYFM